MSRFNNNLIIISLTNILLVYKDINIVDRNYYFLYYINNKIRLNK